MSLAAGGIRCGFCASCTHRVFRCVPRVDAVVMALGRTSRRVSGIQTTADSPRLGFSFSARRALLTASGPRHALGRVLINCVCSAICWLMSALCQMQQTAELIVVRGPLPVPAVGPPPGAQAAVCFSSWRQLNQFTLSALFERRFHLFSKLVVFSGNG